MTLIVNEPAGSSFTNATVASTQLALGTTNSLGTVPEPASISMMALGLAGVGLMVRRQRRIKTETKEVA